MLEHFITASLFVIGAIFGSFAVAQVWRIRLKQLSSTKKLAALERAELKTLAKLKSATTKDRSRCLSCNYTLAARDLIPIFSWLVLRGRCRQCKKPIGPTEVLTEILLAAAFAASFVLWPTPLESALAITQFIIWLIILVVITILLIYDLRWQLLPTFLLTTFIILAGLFVLCDFQTLFTASTLFDLLVSILILSGTYFILHHASQGRWVGSGDWLLALPLAIILQNWLLAIITLFLANFIGCLVVIPSLISKKLTTNSSVPLGPLLLIAFLIIFFAGPTLLANIHL